jgi:hypothetical protein
VTVAGRSVNSSRRLSGREVKVNWTPGRSITQKSFESGQERVITRADVLRQVILDYWKELGREGYDAPAGSGSLDCTPPVFSDGWKLAGTTRPDGRRASDAGASPRSRILRGAKPDVPPGRAHARHGSPSESSVRRRDPPSPQPRARTFGAASESACFMNMTDPPFRRRGGCRLHRSACGHRGRHHARSDETPERRTAPGPS